MMMHNIATIAAQLFLALSGCAPTAAADADVSSVVVTPTLPPQQAECVCSPRAYTFRLNFNGRCDNKTINSVTTFCLQADTAPVEITTVQIIERDVELNIVQQKDFVDANLKDGDTFEYTSISNELNRNEPLGDQQQKVPRSIRIYLADENALGEPSEIGYAVAWTYDVAIAYCDAEPIVEGDVFGLIEVVEYVRPIREFCDAVETEPPTESPSEVETEPPSESPSEVETEQPSESPTEVETEPPSESPTEVETEPPTKSPTIASATTFFGPDPPTESPTVASMSYAASFSVAHAKAAKATKAKVYKAGKSIKNGELIRTRN